MEHFHGMLSWILSWNRFPYNIKKKKRGNVSKYNLLDIDPEAVVQSFIKKETLAQVFSCEFYEISKNTFFTEHLWTTASVDR